MALTVHIMSFALWLARLWGSSRLFCLDGWPWRCMPAVFRSFHDDNADIKRETTHTHTHSFFVVFLMKLNNGHLCQAVPLSTHPTPAESTTHPPPAIPAYSVNICCSLPSSCGVVKELLLVVVVACICMYVTMRGTKFMCIHVYDNPEVQQLFLYTILCFTKWCTSPHPFFGMTEPFGECPFHTQPWHLLPVRPFDLPFAPVPTCLKHVARIQFRISKIFTKYWRGNTLTHFILNAV